jgi:hypothetical protein
VLSKLQEEAGLVQVARDAKPPATSTGVLPVCFAKGGKLGQGCKKINFKNHWSIASESEMAAESAVATTSSTVESTEGDGAQHAESAEPVRLPWTQAPLRHETTTTAADVAAAKSKITLAAAVSRKSIEDVKAAKPPARSGGRAPAEFTKSVPVRALDGTWRPCTLNHLDPAIERYAKELLKQRSDHLTMCAAVDGRRNAAEFVRPTVPLAPPLPTANGAAQTATPQPPPNQFAVLARATARVEQLKVRLGLEYGEGYELTAGKKSYGARADADAPVTQASAQRARHLEAQVAEAQRSLDLLLAGVQDSSASVSATAPHTAAGTEAAEPAFAVSSQDQMSAAEAWSASATIDVEQELAECEAEHLCDGFFFDGDSIGSALLSDTGDATDGPTPDGAEASLSMTAPDDDDEEPALRDMCSVQ